MPHPETIRAQTSPEDAALFSLGLRDSKYRPENHLAFTEDVRQIMRLETPPIRAGTKVVYSLDKTCTEVEDFEWQLTLPALDIPVDGTFIRYCDYVLHALIKSITWTYGANTLQQYPSMDVSFSDLKLMLDEQRFNEDFLVGGSLSAAARNTFAAAPRTLRVLIPRPWADKPCQNPIISALSNKLTLTIETNVPGAFIQTDGTKPSTLTISDALLVYQQIHFTGATRTEITALQNEQDGISYLFDDVTQSEFDIPANALKGTGNEFPYIMQDVDGPVRKISMLIRTQEQLDPTAAGTAPYEIDPVYLEGLRYRIISNNMDIQDPEYQLLDGVRKIQKYYKCRLDTQQGVFLFEEFPTMQNVASGNITFGNFSSPKLLLSNASLNGDHPALHVTLIVKRHNWLVHQRGVIQKVWR